MISKSHDEPNHIHIRKNGQEQRAATLPYDLPAAFLITNRTFSQLSVQMLLVISASLSLASNPLHLENIPSATVCLLNSWVYQQGGVEVR
jgi:hypothetical protein